MIRRHFLASSAAAAAYFSLNSFLSKSSLKVGVVTSLFNFSGYPKAMFSSLVGYHNHKEGYHDLQTGKIDALISSANFIGSTKPEFALFGSLFVANNKHKWIEENYKLVAAYHAEQGLCSSYLGSMSPLMVRISNLNSAQLGSWDGQSEQVSIAAAGIRKVWFDQIGLNVPTHQNSLRLTAQLAQVSNNVLNVTDAFPPTLFLRSLQQNNAYGIATQFGPNSTLFVDSLSKSSVPIELYFKKENELETQPLQNMVRDAVNNDISYQQAALTLLLEQTRLPLAHKLPDSLSFEIDKCNETYLQFLSTCNFSAKEAVKRFSNYRRA